MNSKRINQEVEKSLPAMNSKLVGTCYVYTTVNNQNKVQKVVSNDSLPHWVEQSNYLSEWIEISTSYHALKKEIDKKNLKP